MKLPILFLLTIMISACENRTAPIITMHFGTSALIWDRSGSATDYIPDFKTRIPLAAQKCQVHLLGASSFTDGGAAAYFQSHNGIQSAMTCLTAALPQGQLEVVEPSEWNKMREVDPSFPASLSLIPEMAVPPEAIRDTR